MWGATASSLVTSGTMLHFNPRSPCGERRASGVRINHRCVISIPAPRVGSDCKAFPLYRRYRSFQSTLPVWGATSSTAIPPLRCPPFQSTLPVWGATASHVGIVVSCDDFNPRSPCGERLVTIYRALRRGIFQSTLPVWGATGCQKYFLQRALEFQSTLPVWGATIPLRA